VERRSSNPKRLRLLSRLRRLLSPSTPPMSMLAPGASEKGLYLHANQLEMHGITMLHLIATAYGVSEDKIFGGPN
jgi:hypothetical protein